MITPDTLAFLRAVQAELMPDWVEVLNTGGTTNDLGEVVPGYQQTGYVLPGRLGDENGASRFLARPVDDASLILTVPATAWAAADAFRINGTLIVERAGPDRNAHHTVRTVRRIPVRIVSPGTVTAVEVPEEPAE